MKDAAQTLLTMYVNRNLSGDRERFVKKKKKDRCKESGLDGIGIGAAAQRGSQESANGDAPAHRNHDDLVVDCGAVGDGALADGAKCKPRGRLKRANQ